MVRKKANLSKRTLLGALFIAAVFLLLLRREYTKELNFLFVKVFNPVLSIPPVAAHRGERGYGGLGGSGFLPKSAVSRAEFNKLLADYDNLSAVLRAEHKRYEKLARIRSELPGLDWAALVLAEVRNATAAPFDRELIINKGEGDNLKVGQYVLGQNSIIGSISQTSKRWSRVRLLTDPKCSIEIGIFSQKNKKYIYGRMVGTGAKFGKIPLISTEHEVQSQDTVYAMAQKGLLETPIVIGKISKVEPDKTEPLLWDIEVKPIVEAEKLDLVAVIVIEP